MIVATLLEPHLAALEAAVAECGPTADAFEIRLDALVEPVEPARLRALTAKPLIATLRRTREGGGYAGDEQQRLQRLKACQDAGFDFVDVELDAAPTGLVAARTIRSHHELRATPRAAGIGRLASEQPQGSVFKFAAATRGLGDVLHLLDAARALQRQGRPHAIMGLGDFPRPLVLLLGSAFVYGGGRTNAPGQPSHRELRETLRHWGGPTAAARLGLVVGDPIGHSLSPRMHNAAFQTAHVDAAFGALRIRSSTELQMLLGHANELGLLGLSVTSPLKDAAFELCARRSPEAEAARAVNCISFESGAPIGHNTDGIGAAHLAVRLASPDASILVLGTGGAARAILSQWPSKQVSVTGRTPEHLRALERRHNVTTVPWGLASHELDRHQVLVNATTELDPIPLGDFRGALFDLHYGAKPTPWQLHAQRTGAAFVGGRELLLEQGVRAFRIWTGEDPNVPAMRNALEAAA